jgi:VIT1/CCC1 family predicted Fe2+/Mn2+ transporter
MIGNELKEKLLRAQRNEITEHLVYEGLSQSVKDVHNKGVLKRISADELKHYDFWKQRTQEDVKPNKLSAWKYLLISRIFGITFGLKLMEKGEQSAQATYSQISESIPMAASIVADEDEHETQLLNLMDEERLRYVGSMVLGLNDALVELTGALAGLTLVLEHARLVAMAGLITGIAASLSMAASEYLSTKTEGAGKNPMKASVYTGSAYILTVMFLIFPYLLLTDLYLSLGLTITNALIIIAIFTYYISVAKDLPFWKRFMEMALISLGIAALTFAIGMVVKVFLET